MVDYLSACEIDVFDAVLARNGDRISALADDDPAVLSLTLAEARGGTDGENDWKTPLASAVIGDWSEGVELLLQLGADPTIRNLAGTPLLEIARSESSPAIAAMLERAAR